MSKTRTKKNGVKGFISYSHDTAAHSERVLALAWALRSHGIEIELDQFHNEEIIDWPRWCNEQTSRGHSDFILCVCTAEYRRRIEGNVPPEKGKGVYWEGSLLDDDMYDAKGNRRILPLLFDNEPESSIPRFLRGWTYCRLGGFALTDAGYQHVLRILTGQARVLQNELGRVPELLAKSLSSSSSPPARLARPTPPHLLGSAPEHLVDHHMESVPRGPGTLGPLVQIALHTEIRLFDPAVNKYRRLPWDPSELSGSESKDVVSHVRSWKQVHKLAERLVSALLKVRVAVSDARHTRNPESVQKALSVLNAVETEIRDSCGELKLLARPVCSSPVIRPLIDLRLLANAVRQDLASDLTDHDYLVASMHLFERATEWALHALHIADLIIEKHLLVSKDRKR